MIRRLATSRWVRLALLALALGLCAYGLVSQRAEVASALHQLSWGWVIGATIAVLAAMGCMMLSWRALLADLGSPLPLRTATRVLFIAQLGKYLPGAVWVAAAQVELGREHEIPRRRSATAAVVSMLVALATALLVAAVALPLSSRDAIGQYWWALALAPPALICLYPPLTGFLADRALRLARRPPLEHRISGAGMARAVAWSLLGWVFFSVHAWLLVADMTGQGASVFLIAAARVRAGVVGRVHPHPVPRWRGAEGTRADHGVGAGHAARVRDRGRRHFPARPDGRGPGLGGRGIRARLSHAARP